MILLHQSSSDLRAPDDITVDGDGLVHQVQENSQNTQVFSCQSNPETAECAAR